MKKIISIITFMAAVFAFTACSEDDSPQITSTVAPTLNSLAVDTISSDGNEFTFTWTAARFYLDNGISNTSIGSYESQGIKYDLQVDTIEGDFSQGVSLGQAVSKQYLNIAPADMKAILVDKFGLSEDDGSVNLLYRIVATYSSTDSLKLVSNTTRSAFKFIKGTGPTTDPNDHSEPDFNDGLTHRIYVEVKNDWTDLCIYAWNETGNMAGWPGVHYTEKVTMGGHEWYAFDMPSDYQHRAGLNYIFNDNNQGKQFDAMGSYTFNHDLFITVNADNTYTTHPGPVYTDGAYTMYVNIDDAGWEGKLALYAYADGEPFDAGWPGNVPEGPISINGKQWYYHTYVTDKKLNVILNNNGGGQQTSDVVTNYDMYVTVGAGNSVTTTSGIYK